MDIQELIDAKAIERVMVDYFDRIDALDPIGASQLFAEDATADLMTGKIYQSRDHIGRALGRILLQYRHTSHHISNHRSVIEGDTATAQTYIYAFHRFPDDSIWHLWARHVDKLARIGDGWQLTERILVPIDSTPEWDLIDDSWYRPHPGRRTHEDLHTELDAFRSGQ
ncbi:MAG: nuclear transport factor 2 family protein [bacterium]|nr:nuclear transport factor 2 family protein [bacterium]